MLPQLLVEKLVAEASKTNLSFTTSMSVNKATVNKNVLSVKKTIRGKCYTRLDISKTSIYRSSLLITITLTKGGETGRAKQAFLTWVKLDDIIENCWVIQKICHLILLLGKLKYLIYSKLSVNKNLSSQQISTKLGPDLKCKISRTVKSIAQ